MSTGMPSRTDVTMGGPNCSRSGFQVRQSPGAWLNVIGNDAIGISRGLGSIRVRHEGHNLDHPTSTPSLVGVGPDRFLSSSILVYGSAERASFPVPFASSLWYLTRTRSMKSVSYSTNLSPRSD
jgi:hypothetical protein